MFVQGLAVELLAAVEDYPQLFLLRVSGSVVVYVECHARFRIRFFRNFFGVAVVDHLLHEIHILFRKLLIVW